jgi:hypothetical protein
MGASRHWHLRAEVTRLCLLLVVASLVGSYVYRTAQRNLDWRDNYTLFSRFIETDHDIPSVTSMSGMPFFAVSHSKRGPFTNTRYESSLVPFQPTSC